ncbi:hypothetical protein [Prauserella sp. PE36]|uniref:hypothetical protein n=1 Tax=Prauserella sp. PE36 TaxID=1504709 RepID=UPI001F39F3EE|nr:hypothetical protein [Prauserella sp. PE36]
MSKSPQRWNPGWLVLAGACAAFAAFEIVKHQGWTIPAGIVGAALPLAGRLGKPVRVVAGHWAPPVVVLAAFTFLPDTNEQAAPGFTLGLTWLAHVAIARAARKSAA